MAEAGRGAPARAQWEERRPMVTLKDKFRGCIAASWIGSAMGAAVEGWSREEAEAEANRQFQERMASTQFGYQTELTELGGDIAQRLQELKYSQGQQAAAWQTFMDWASLDIQGEINADERRRGNKMLAQLWELFGMGEPPVIVERGQYKLWG